jgi:hypothetical protein
MKITDFVVKRETDAYAPHGRAGTVRCDVQKVRELLGMTNIGRSCDDKVTFGWCFNTPRGIARLGDYWWNRADELSVWGSHKSAKWLCRYLRHRGIPAMLDKEWAVAPRTTYDRLPWR